MDDFRFNKLGVLNDAVMWTVEYKGLVYRFDSYIPDDIDTKHFIREHIEELEVLAKYDKMGVWNDETKNGDLKRKIWHSIDDFFAENDIDVFGYGDADVL